MSDYICHVIVAALLENYLTKENRRMSMSNYVHIEVDEIIRETDKAFLFLIGDDEIWIPKSQVSDADDYEMGDKNCSISVTEFIANEKGLE